MYLKGIWFGISKHLSALRGACWASRFGKWRHHVSSWSRTVCSPPAFPLEFSKWTRAAYHVALSREYDWEHSPQHKELTFLTVVWFHERKGFNRFSRKNHWSMRWSYERHLKILRWRAARQLFVVVTGSFFPVCEGYHNIALKCQKLRRSRNSIFGSAFNQWQSQTAIASLLCKVVRPCKSTSSLTTMVITS